MIQAEEFVEAARNKGFQWYAGVPCSFLTPLIDYVIDDRNLTYISSANEGDAVAAAAGAFIGGKRSIVMMQNSGLGNAINPLTSLTYTFRIPILIICTSRGEAHLHDEPQHELMGQITGKLLETMNIPWEFFPQEVAEVENVLQRAEDYMQQERRPYALVMRKGTVAPNAIKKTGIVREGKGRGQERGSHSLLVPKLSRNQALRRIVEFTPPETTVVIATTGYTGRELFTVADRSNHLYVVGSMGCASSLALGFSLARPDLKVAIVDGDGAALMRMGNFATIGSYGGSNLLHILLDNEVYDSTGAQATVSGEVSFAKIAAACGYEIAIVGDDLSSIDDLFTARSEHRPKFAHLKILPGTLPDLPRPDRSPENVLQRLMTHIGSSC